MDSQPRGNELTEDNESAGQSERNQRERDEEKSAKAALPEGPAVAWEIVGAADAFHQRGEDAGRSGEADDERNDEGVSRTGAVRRVDEIALQQRTDVGGKDAVKEGGQLEAERSVVGKETDDSGGDDEGGKERHHRGVGGGLGEVETVVPRCAKEGAVENAGKTQESSHEIVPRVVRMARDQAFHLFRKSRAAEADGATVEVEAEEAAGWLFLHPTIDPETKTRSAIVEKRTIRRFIGVLTIIIYDLPLTIF